MSTVYSFTVAKDGNTNVPMPYKATRDYIERVRVTIVAGSGAEIDATEIDSEGRHLRAGK